MIKRHLLFLLFGLITVIPTSAGSSKSADAVSMISYEQSWLDSRGTLALKNNLSGDINSIVFRIQYLDMSGNPLDYADYTKEIHIAPGMTKKVDIPAYEHDRFYHYYKTKDEFGHPAFKIIFEVKDYNIEVNESSSEYDDDDYLNDSRRNDTFPGAYFIIIIIAVFVLIGISVGLYILVAVMAQKRHRSVVLWVFLSLIGSPLLMAIILLIIGDAEDRELI